MAMWRLWLVMCVVLHVGRAQQGVVTKESASLPVAASPGSAMSCDYDIHYNEWVPTFQPREYEHNDKNGKVHCLEACCRDPTCTGLALESALDSQCYKYDEAPRHLNKGQDLAAFLVGERSSEWSVFVKRVQLAPQTPHVGVPVAETVVQQGALPRLSDKLQAALTAMPHRSKTLASEEFALDRKLRGMAGSQFGECQWSVHYDTWLPSFDQGEYSHDDKFEGAHAHCLDQCCQDPTCVGLSLMSNELHQCYKYSSKPQGLKGHGKRLGDGQWLLRKRPTWSVMIKATHPLAHSSSASAAHSKAPGLANSAAPPQFVATAVGASRSTEAGKASGDLTPEYIAAAAAAMEADRLTQQRRFRPQAVPSNNENVLRQDSSDRGVFASLADLLSSDAMYHLRWIAVSALVVALALRVIGDYSDALARSIGLQGTKMELKHVPGAAEAFLPRREKAPLLGQKTSAGARGGFSGGLDTFGGTA